MAIILCRGLEVEKENERLYEDSVNNASKMILPSPGWKEVFLF